MLLFLDLEVHALLQLAGDAIGLGILRSIVVGEAGDDQRRSRFVDQNVVDFVDDREVERPLNLDFLRRLHVVAKVVEAELVIRSVRDVGVVGDFPLVGVHVRLDGPDGQPETEIQRAHPLHVAAGQVVVDCNDMDGPSQAIEKGGQRRDERLAFARDHFGDHSLVQEVTADHLHVVMPHLQEAASRLADGGKRIGQNVVERFSGRQTRANLRGGLFQLFVREFLPVGLLGINPVEYRARNHPLSAGPLISIETEFADAAAVGRTEQECNKTLNGGGDGRKPNAEIVKKIHSTQP